MIASIIACINMLASQERRRIVSDVLRRVRIGASISSAEDSKNEMTELSEIRISKTTLSKHLILCGCSELFKRYKSPGIPRSHTTKFNCSHMLSG
jgi:hypothetical protein